MKTFQFVVAAALSTSSCTAFIPRIPRTKFTIRSHVPLMAKLEMTPELEAAIDEVREAASSFGEQTAHFANGELSLNFAKDC